MQDSETDVLIVGAGPVGLLLAGELRRSGVRVVIVDRLPSPMTESRASLLNTRTAELLHERGFDALLDPAIRETRAHFAGLPLDLSRLDSEFAGNWKVPQYRTESVFAERAAGLGATLLRSHELVGVGEFDDHVGCAVDTPVGRRDITARYVVGCDGAASTVRRLGGFDAARTAATKELFRADVTGIDIRDRRFERLPGGFAVAATRGGVTRVMMHATGDSTGGAPAVRTSPPEFAEVAACWAKVTGEDISAGTAIWLDAFDNAMGQAGEYRRGRVLLAGDAAHWHLPIGGQALNVGLQDAINLGWKLAGAVTGSAPPGVLDSYHRERHPAAARVLAYVAAQEMLLLGGAEVEPLRSVFAELLELPPAHDHLARLAAGLDDPAEPDGGPLAGRRLPRVTLRTAAGAVTVAELLAGGTEGAVLRVPGSARGLSGTASAAVALKSGRRLRTVSAIPEPAGALGGATRLLLRPDGYVAWAGDDEPGLGAAIRRWFGAALCVPGPVPP
jgi:2-polyprenyl-6-methoxyphenol hydroxylase-like FAD-dependent oxidoreductase